MADNWIESLLALERNETEKEARERCTEVFDELYELIERTKERGGVIAQLAAELDIDPNTLSKWKRAPPKLIQMRILEKLSAPKYERLHSASKKAIAALQALRVVRVLNPIP